MPGRTMTPFRSPLTYTVRVVASRSSSRPCTARSSVSCVAGGQGLRGQSHHHVTLLELVVPRLPLPVADAFAVVELATACTERPALVGKCRHQIICGGVEARPDHAHQ